MATDFQRGINAAAALCEAKAVRVGKISCRGKDQDAVTRGVVAILTDTAEQIRHLPDQRS